MGFGSCRQPDGCTKPSNGVKFRAVNVPGARLRLSPPRPKAEALPGTARVAPPSNVAVAIARMEMRLNVGLFRRLALMASPLRVTATIRRYPLVALPGRPVRLFCLCYIPRYSRFTAELPACSSRFRAGRIPPPAGRLCRIFPIPTVADI
jgi:hypothetical protein